MAASDSRLEYQRRLHRVLAAIDDNLDQPLDLAALAEVAHFSPFHFHRLFTALMGETVGDHLRRRRLEVAAMRMAAQPRMSVLSAALSVGFGSGEAFARAFSRHFGASPSDWRRHQAAGRAEHRVAQRKAGQADRKTGQATQSAAADDQGLFNLTVETPMNVRLIVRPPVTIAYLRCTGPYGEATSRFWQEQYYPWAATHQLLGHARYGISLDDPGITAPERCRYDAAAEVPRGFVPSGGAFSGTVAGGRYAVLPFTGRADQIGEAWAALLRDWLPGSGLQLDARPAFEHYPPDAVYNPETGVFSCEICIPVAPL